MCNVLAVPYGIHKVEATAGLDLEVLMSHPTDPAAATAMRGGKLVSFEFGTVTEANFDRLDAETSEIIGNATTACKVAHNGILATNPAQAASCGIILCLGSDEDSDCLFARSFTRSFIGIITGGTGMHSNNITGGLSTNTWKVAPDRDIPSGGDCVVVYQNNPTSYHRPDVDAAGEHLKKSPKKTQPPKKIPHVCFYLQRGQETVQYKTSNRNPVSS
mmetsp:Transcript_22962/g.50038  ORF Transcript_22962/g.50038 Transcript_22962/m.50038 type:complete len:217 (-) Transcript_22962:1451-2101(-)